jgi:hypothetical protein
MKLNIEEQYILPLIPKNLPWIDILNQQFVEKISLCPISLIHANAYLYDSGLLVGLNRESQQKKSPFATTGLCMYNK